jgi:predicted cupin superfamily sugar epimerase
MTDWRGLVERLQLAPHPEGGFYRETYRAAGEIPADSLRGSGHGGARRFSTAIYYLLPPHGVSRLHRMRSDEIFHFYLGGPMTLVELSPNGESATVSLGQDVAAGQRLQHKVAAGTWFGGWAEAEYSLVGCTVAPGFDFADFELGDRQSLLRAYPDARALIERLMGPTPQAR